LPLRHHVRVRALLPIKLNYVVADAIARPDESDQLDIEIGLRSRQRQCEEKFAKGSDGNIGLCFADELKTLAIDDGRMKNAAIGHGRQLTTASVAGGRPRFSADGDISDMAMFDLVAVDTVSAEGVGIVGSSPI
jgi:hypothetical protein